MAAETDLELRHLRALVAVAERLSFTRAADDLHIAQQAVSQQIKALERTLGVTLLRRTPRRVELTPEGSVFLADCRRVLAAADRAARRPGRRPWRGWNAPTCLHAHHSLGDPPPTP